MLHYQKTVFRFKQLFTICFFVASAFDANSQHTVQYHPDCPAMLGSGFDPKSPQQIFAIPCIESDGVENIDTKQGVVEGNISIKEIRNRKELFQAMGASLAIEASYGMFSGSTSLSNSVSVSFESTSLIWTASININYGRWRLKNPRASKALQDAPNQTDVLRICGGEVFTQETRGAFATVIFELRGLNETEKKEVSEALAFAASGVGGGVSADQKYKNVMNKVQESSQLSVYVNVQGGPGPKALSPIIENPSDLGVIRKTLKDYISKTNQDNARPLSFQTSSISQFKPVQYTTAPDLGQDRLIEIYDQYINLTSLIRRIDELIKPTSETDKVYATFVSDKKRTELQGDRNIYENAREMLRTAGLECLKNGEGCAMPQIANLPRIDWPDIPSVPKVFIIRRCEWNMLFVVGHQFMKGEKVGSLTYDLALTGNEKLFKSVKLITSDSEIPLSIVTKADEASNHNQREINPILKEIQLSISVPNEKCETRNYDESQVFAKIISLNIDKKYQIPIGKIKVEDVFGRVYTYDLEQF